jgi:hypothetical protein
MKALLALLSLAIVPAFAVRADAPLLNDGSLPVVAAPSFKEPLVAPFSVAKGKWEPENGVLAVTNIPEEKHIPVLHHKAGLASAVIECEFRFDGPGPFLVGCDSDTHVGRVVIGPQGISIAEDSAKPSHTIEKLDFPVSKDAWHTLRVEWKGDRMAARLDGRELRARHPFLATKKARSWLAAGQSVKVRNLRISGE